MYISVLAASTYTYNVTLQFHILSLSLDQLLLDEDSNLIFVKNSALRKGGGIYVTKDLFIFVPLNKDCFIQYHSSTDDSPNTWVNMFNVCLYH